VTPRIEVIAEKKLVGIGAKMSLAEDSTTQLWRNLMPRRGEIRNRVSSDYISMRVYGDAGMTLDEMFAPGTVFEKWAAVEVADCDSIPEGMASCSVSAGMYAVFLHKGPARTFPQTMRYIFGTWLPASGCELDDREHFEVIPEGWDALDEQGQEEIWIPIRRVERE